MEIEFYSVASPTVSDTLHVGDKSTFKRTRTVRRTVILTRIPHPPPDLHSDHDQMGDSSPAEPECIILSDDEDDDQMTIPAKKR